MPPRPSQSVPQHLPAFAEKLGLDADDLARVRRDPLFARLDDGALALLLADAAVRRVGRGTVLFLQGEPAERVYLVLEGWVRLVRRSADGREVTIRIFGPGESLGEAVVFLEEPYPVTGEVVEAARLLTIPRRSLMAALDRDPRLARAMIASLARRLHDFVRQVEQLTGRSTTERVAGFLLRYCPGSRGPCTVELPLDKTLIAARLGMQPESFSRALARLRRLGVTSHGRRVEIADPAALRAFLGEEP